ncbi:conserved hypothetical protein [Candidatus Zixiibacteriota bacterium]|nr:conserved hypothetical protein [candidate division Zixibacteria bacterium]
MKRFRLAIFLLTVLLYLSGCVYFNTFYYARKNFNSAESKRIQAEKKGTKSVAQQEYKKALEKSQKVLDKYPKSSWIDDALFINGVSNYYLSDYSKAEKRFRELLADYPKSKYVKESQLYLAKSKLMMDEESDAMVLFEKLFTGEKDKKIKAEAARALGTYYFDEKDYDKAEHYFQTLVDSLGDDQDKIVAQMNIADGYYARFKYKPALDRYLKVLKNKIDLKTEYKATFRAGECCLYLYQIDDGMNYFNKLISNPLMYDSLQAVKLMMAYGYQLDGDLARAEDIYKSVADNNQRMTGAEANYNLGLIYQFDYEDYKKAKDYYDKAKTAGSGTAIYQDALQRSSDIGKLQEYSKKREFDSTTKPETLDSAAQTQYLLAELYLTQLDKEDSAYNEFQAVLDNFPHSTLAPKALIAIAVMKRDYFSDTLGFDSALRKVLADYPRSDYTEEAISLLGLSGTRADTGYASYYYRQGEKFALDSATIDSARYYFQIVVDSFPRSKLNNQARFSLLWLTETYQSPSDSSLYYAYADFADSFPNTEYGKIVDKKLIVKPKPQKQVSDTGNTEAPIYAAADSSDTTTQQFVTPEERYYIDPDGNKIGRIDQDPIKVDREFKFPASAYSLKFSDNLYLYFQIKINPFGDVEDVRLMNPTSSDDLNEEATDIVRLSHFNTHIIPPELMNSWFVYKYTIVPPSLR